MNTAPLPDSVQNALLAFLQNTFRHRLQDTHPLLLNGIPLGRLTASWRQRLQQDWTGRLQARADGLLLETDSWHDMAAMLQETARRWHEAGYFGGWRGEQCDVHDGGGHLLFTLERSAFRPLGLASRAVHINGCCETPAGLRFWIARRSPHKAVDPGKLDNLTGGGIAAGETSVCAMYRETWEEAGIPPDTAAAAHPAECLFSSHPVRRGLHREYLHIFDLRLPHGFTPQNQDGEVASFSLMTAEDTAAAIVQGKMMNDSALVTLDFFRRLGLVSPQHPLAEYLQSFQSTGVEAV